MTLQWQAFYPEQLRNRGGTPTTTSGKAKQKNKGPVGGDSRTRQQANQE